MCLHAVTRHPPPAWGTFGLEQWRDAFRAIAKQGDSGAVKVAFGQR